MIDSLQGELLSKAPDHVVVDCHGVGYLVHVAANTYAHLLRLGEASGEARPASGPCRFHVHYTVTVDVRSGSSEHRLYGFLHPGERALFRRLIEVQGVSATIGMAIMGARPARETEAAIMAGDEGALKAIKGIGPKLAQRIVAELRGKLVPGTLPGGPPHGGPVHGGGNTLRAEALSALASIGVDRMKAERSLQAVLSEHPAEPPELEELIRLTLKNL